MVKACGNLALLIGAILVNGPVRAVAQDGSPKARPVPLLELETATREPFPSAMLLTLDTAPGTLAIQPDGKILVGSALGGWFVDEQSGMVGWYSRGVIRLESDGSIDRSFYCNIDRPTVVIPGSAHLDLLTDGRIFVSGTFSMSTGTIRFFHSSAISTSFRTFSEAIESLLRSKTSTEHSSMPFAISLVQRVAP